MNQIYHFSYSDATLRKTNWAHKVWTSWCTERNNRIRQSNNPDAMVITGSLQSHSTEQLNYIMTRFILEVKNLQGQDYSRETLYDLVVSLQMYLNRVGRNVRFLEQDEFQSVKHTLDHRMKQLSKEGKINQKSKAEPISYDEEEKMWDMKILGDETPEMLLNTVLYLIGVNFSLRAADEHKSLQVGILGQIKCHVDEKQNCKFLEYTERRSKNHQGGLADKNVKPKVVRCYENVANPKRCLVRLYQKYLAKRPSHDVKCSRDLYLRPLKNPSEFIWYSCQPLGVSTISQVVAKLADMAGLKGFKTNHSLRATAPTRLYEAGVDEQLITEITGHRSNAVRDYKRTNPVMQRNISAIISGVNPVSTSQTSCSSTSTSQSVPNLDFSDLTVEQYNNLRRKNPHLPLLGQSSVPDPHPLLTRGSFQQVTNNNCQLGHCTFWTNNPVFKTKPVTINAKFNVPEDCQIDPFEPLILNVTINLK